MTAGILNLAARAAANREKIQRWIWFPQLLAALVFLGFAYFSGKDRARLMHAGVRTQGTVVAYQPAHFRHSRDLTYSDTAYIPIVEFQTGGRVVRFRDMMGKSVAGPIHAAVVVLYDAANPNIAMIDRGARNLLPWAPPLAIGAFLAIVAFIGFLRGIF